MKTAYCFNCGRLFNVDDSVKESDFECIECILRIWVEEHI
jgi:DNA-directed RNA polymerase subunit RPC12/RpoP